MNQNKRKLLDIYIIEAAANGDEEAIYAVLRHFEAYINKLSYRWRKDENGNFHYYLDEEKKELLRIKLMGAIPRFQFRKET